MEEINELMEQRRKKLDELRLLGIDPYNESFEVKDYNRNLIGKYGETPAQAFDEERVDCSTAGRIVAWRSFGKAAFAHILDGSGEKLQAYFAKDILKDTFPLLKQTDIGDILGISGRLFRTRTNELTIEVHHFAILSKSLRPLPEKWHGLKDVETRYRQRYVDLIVNPQVRATFEVRSRMVKTIRDFLEEHGFVEMETPMMHPIPGGATARPFKTHHHTLDMDLYLRIAPELYLKRLLVGGYDRIFEINRNFRNEGISTKHNPEFSMLEFYIAYKDYRFLMSFTEELIGTVVKKTLGSLKAVYGGTDIDFTPPWKRVTFTDALKEKGVPQECVNAPAKARSWAASQGIKLEEGLSYGNVLDEIFKEKVEPFLIQPTFLIDYPVELSPLAKRKKDDPGLVERFELFIMGREIANAFSELNDPIDQKNRFLDQVEAREKGDTEAHYMDADFIRALEYAMPPAAGEGIGIDRLVMLLTDSPSIRDVILFPQLKPEQ